MPDTSSSGTYLASSDLEVKTCFPEAGPMIPISSIQERAAEQTWGRYGIEGQSVEVLSS